MKKLITTISLIYFLFISLIGIGISMHMDHDDQMANCIFMEGDESVCPMTSSNHISEIRTMLSGVVKSEAIQLIFALSLLVFFVLPIEFEFLRKQIKFKFFQKLNFDLKISDHIFTELYSGILNPKLH